jgi:hypothetical protein
MIIPEPIYMLIRRLVTMPRTPEQKALIQANVATREELDQVTGGKVTVMDGHWGYFTYGATQATRSLDEAYVTHVQQVPEVEKGRLLVLPCDPEARGAEEFSTNSNGTATCNLEAGLHRFNIERKKGFNMVFNAKVEDTEYGPALVVDIKSLHYTKQRTRKKNEPEETDAASGQMPKA